MSNIQLCEPTELYNILNQTDLKGLPCVSDRTYLLLLDVREYSAYEESHIVTARHSIRDSAGGDFQIPADAEVETKHHCVVYDSCTESLSDKESDVYCCAKMLSELTCRKPIMILSGGYEKFSALYPLLKSFQIIFSPRELQGLKLYPLEVVPGTVYMGTASQANDPELMKRLAVKCLVNASPEVPVSVAEGVEYKEVALNDSADVAPHLREISQLIEKYRAKKIPILVVSSDSLSRSVVLILAYLMKRNKWTLEKSWRILKQNKSYIRPTLGYMKHLSNFEEEVCEERTTNIAIPNLM